MLTLDEFAETIVRPMTLRLVGLPDTPEANEFLDAYVAALLKPERTMQNDAAQEAIAPNFDLAGTLHSKSAQQMAGYAAQTQRLEAHMRVNSEALKHAIQLASQSGQTDVPDVMAAAQRFALFLSGMCVIDHNLNPPDSFVPAPGYVMFVPDAEAAK